MVVLFYFSDLELPATISIGIIGALIILLSPILVFYSVFSGSNKKEKKYKVIREVSKWLSLIFTSLTVIIFCLPKFFAIANLELLFLGLVVSSALTFIFGVISLPRWQGFLSVFFYIGYCVYFFTL